MSKLDIEQRIEKFALDAGRGSLSGDEIYKFCKQLLMDATLEAHRQTISDILDEVVPEPAQVYDFLDDEHDEGAEDVLDHIETKRKELGI
jgi:hypothetical protein